MHDVQHVCDQVIILVRGQVRLADSIANMQRPIQSGLQIRVVRDAERFAEALRQKGLTVQTKGDSELKVEGDATSISKIVWEASGQNGSIG